MKRNLQRLWPDVPRLLKSREQFRDFANADTVSSVPAFLAWKAFLFVARSEEGRTERDKCHASVAASMRTFADRLSPATREFASALQHFRQASPAIVADWYLPVDSPPTAQSREQRVTLVLRQIRRLGEQSHTTDTAGSSGLADGVAHQLYDIRNAVLAHSAVLSTGNLFTLVVPPFERLTAVLALAGWARRANITLEEAEEQTGVVIT